MKDVVDLDLLVDESPELDTWFELIADTIPQIIEECKTAGDPLEKAVHQATTVALEVWGDKPLPPQETSANLPELILALARQKYNPTRATETYVSTDDIQDWLGKAPTRKPG
jgi:hypothetical protein